MVESPKSVPDPSSSGQNQLPLWRRTPPLVLPMLVLSGGLIVAGAVAVKGIRTATDTVTVTGASTERLRSDYADWTVTVSGGGLSQQQAYQNLQPDLKRTLAFLQAAGIPESNTQLTVLRTDRNDIRNRVTGMLTNTEWTARQSIHVGSADVALIRKASRWKLQVHMASISL